MPATLDAIGNDEGRPVGTANELIGTIQGFPGRCLIDPRDLLGLPIDRHPWSPDHTIVARVDVVGEQMLVQASDRITGLLEIGNGLENTLLRRGLAQTVGKIAQVAACGRNVALPNGGIQRLRLAIAHGLNEVGSVFATAVPDELLESLALVVVGPASAAQAREVAVLALEDHPFTDTSQVVHPSGPCLGGQVAILDEDGRTRNLGAIDYRIPTSKDLPIELVSASIENHDGPGPYGVKGVSEGSLLCTAPAVGAAVRDATGLVIRDLPLTPQRVWEAMREQET